ncbi:hypothetical protein PAXRUDRAFT_17542 [Paxillus rubicundulus Ve08.2h10]|uniref:Uncharacterized protein n=1 Tax=Paxillus rubicundulus Ve08.2h10 TaxID=930991 RepID=A0A0D0CPW2_9AGAM|nr:hypothetical protein PAXRUDRAFT_17542 [Paxillus rubicundulus Ve08.2h10]
MGMGFEDSEGLPQAQHNNDAAGLYYEQQEAAEGTAGSYYGQQGAASQENAQLNDLQDYFTDEIPVNKLHMTQKLVEVMSRTQFAFQAHASHMVELSFRLVPEILGEPNDKAHKHDAIKKLLDGDWIDVLHRVEKVIHQFPPAVVVY